MSDDARVQSIRSWFKEVPLGMCLMCTHDFCQCKCDDREANAALDALAAEVEEMRATITEQHAKLWLVGLDTHPDEEQQPVERSVRNLRRLLADDAGAAE